MRDLTNPITQTQTTKQFIDRWGINLVLNNSGGIDMAKSFFRYRVTSLPEGGSVPETIYAQDLPAAVRTKLKEIHALVHTDAENKNLLESGTDTDDL